MPDRGENGLTGVWEAVPAPYRCAEISVRADEGLTLSRRGAESLRDRLFQKMESDRLARKAKEAAEYRPPAKRLPRADKPLLTVKVAKLGQITPELLALPPERLYVPLWEASEDTDQAERLVRSETVPVAALPRTAGEPVRAEVAARLRALHGIGFREALVYSPGQARLALECGYTPRAGWYTANSEELGASKRFALSSTVAPWLSLREISGLTHLTDTEMIVYGRLPLLLARQCLIRRKNGMCACENTNDLSDGKGNVFPMIREGEHGTLVLQSQKLWLEPYRRLWRRLGLWAARLEFTTENARECAKVAEAFAGHGDYRPNAVTTGYYAPDSMKKKRWPL